MTPVGVRARLVEALQADLIGPFQQEPGPGGLEEVLPLPPSRWYLTGFLAPHHGRAPDVDDQDSVGELAGGSESQAEDAGSSEPEAKRPQRFPASLGLSVFLPPAPVDGDDAIEVEIAYADYVKEPLDPGGDAKESGRGRGLVGWRRVPRGPYRVKVPLQAETLASSEGIRCPDDLQLCFRGELRATQLDGLPAVAGQGG